MAISLVFLTPAGLATALFSTWLLLPATCFNSLLFFLTPTTKLTRRQLLPAPRPIDATSPYLYLGKMPMEHNASSAAIEVDIAHHAKHAP